MFYENKTSTVGKLGLPLSSSVALCGALNLGPSCFGLPAPVQCSLLMSASVQRTPMHHIWAMSQVSGFCEQCKK